MREGPLAPGQPGYEQYPPLQQRGDSMYEEDDGPSALALVLGGLLLVAVGFVAVALALRYFG